jgi:guanylate kinase
LLVFVAPPSRDEQRRRLEARGSDSPEVIETRLAEAAAEEARAGEFDAQVVNDDVDAAVARVAGILASRTAGA